MNKLLQAIALASEGHRAQTRKVDGTPYIAHPLAVGMILQTVTADENILIAGILHDVLEDTRIDPQILREQFAPEVLHSIQGVTEDKAITDWRTRKERSIDHLRTAPYPVKLIAAADKYHNLWTLSEDVKRKGDGIWAVFKRGKAEQGWYYQTLYDLFKAEGALQSLPMILEMQTHLQFLFHEDQDGSPMAPPSSRAP